MMDHPRGRLHLYRLTLFIGVLAITSGVMAAETSPATAAPSEPAIEFINEDASISGKRMYSFTDDGQNVTVVHGGFRLLIGKRSVSSADAVLWITPQKGDRRDIVMYLRGNARVAEANGTVTTDSVMLVTLHQQGGLSASNEVGKAPPNDPLYRQAKAARQAASQPASTATAPAVSPESPLEVDLNAPAAGKTTAKPQATATKPVEPSPKPVSFRADSVSMKESLQPDGPTELANRHVFIARGNVYLSQEDPRGKQLMELRCEAAVIFTEPSSPQQAGGKQLIPQISGLPTANNIAISGIYLEGDVIITHGERMMRAPRGFYDFANAQAIILDPVFRTVQEQRNIPIYIRAEQARQVGEGKFVFKNAKVTTSDFYSPEYHIGASTVQLEDKTAYDEKGEQVGPRSYQAEMKNETFNIRGVPVLWWPYSKSNMAEDASALRRASFGSQGNLGSGVQTRWDLFRLVGLLQPEGVKGTVDLEAYSSGALGGVNLDYARRAGGRQYSGYDKFYGVLGSDEDDFGRERKDISAPDSRGRILMRHKELLPKDVEMQLELSYLSDKNFLEKYFPTEFYGGKEQETLAYFKKQQDNWAVTGLLQYRLNKFQSQSESYPDVGFYLLGEPLLEDHLSFFSENHLGVKRFGMGDDDTPQDVYPQPGQELRTSKAMGRADSRQELNAPLHLGPMNFVPYAVGRGTYWGDTVEGGSDSRPYGQVGLKTNTHIWRVFENANSRLWDVNKLKHIMTPQAAVFASGDGDVTPNDLFPLNPDIEQHLGKINGGSIGLYQRLLTKRGPAGSQHDVDWMRLNVVASFFDSDMATPAADGRFFISRPEYSIPRDSINTEYVWNISDATSFLSYMNYDAESGGVGRADAGLAIARDPRLRYYLGWRYIRDLSSSIGTFGVNYKLNPKYSMSFFEQYDFDFDGGQNQASSVSIIRKFPRWYGAFTFAVDKRTGDTSLFVSFWPEGIPEFMLGGDRLGFFGGSSAN